MKLSILADEGILTGFRPLLTKIERYRQTSEGQTENVTCEADVTQASSVFRINWYLVDPVSNVWMDVAGRKHHSVSECGIAR